MLWVDKLMREFDTFPLHRNVCVSILMKIVAMREIVENQILLKIIIFFQKT